MAIALPGQTFTFQVLFVDSTNVPIVVPDANIEVFTFNEFGVKVTLVVAGTPMSPVFGDTGRYMYAYTVPIPWTYQPTMYGVMRGTDPTTDLDIVVEMEADIPQNTSAACRGLVAQFVKGG